jgi:flagellar basal-body rod modification protein FlgD
MIVNNNYSVDLVSKKQQNIDVSTKEEIRQLNEMLNESHQGSKLELEEQDFLKILTTQLKSQDPTNPVDDKNFITQMAQLTSIRELNNLNKNILSLVSQNSINSSLSMISKTINWIDNQTGQSMSDKVVGVRLNDNGEVFLKTSKGAFVSIKDIVEVE